VDTTRGKTVEIPFEEQNAEYAHHSIILRQQDTLLNILHGFDSEVGAFSSVVA
jgi:hypothetical protein